MTLRRTVQLLLVLVIGAPLLQTVLFWVAGLLAAMGDKAAADVLGRLNTGFGVLWLVALVGLVIAMAVRSLDDTLPPPSSNGSP